MWEILAESRWFSQFESSSVRRPTSLSNNLEELVFNLDYLYLRDYDKDEPWFKEYRIWVKKIR